MDELFWTHQSDFPEGILGTPNFSPTHLTWLSVSIAIIVIAVLVLKKSGNPLRQGTQRVLIILAAVLEISRWIWAAIIGHYTVVEMLPFHLCSLSIWMEMAAVFSGKQLLKDFGYCLCLPGALAALLTPDWSVYPLFSFQYLHSVTVHSLLFLIPLIWVVSDGFRPNFKNLPKCFGILMLFAAPVFVLNLILGSNYLFLREAPKDTPLELFENICGNPGYLVPLFLLVFVIWAVLYFPWAIADLIRSRQTSTETATKA
ncbi:MAG: TIGR02206 family membrane protein [Clostridiaceae bacterium]|nr:TIGR02206 family membrane protein [Clostridiaceae bacterium]